MRRPSLPEWALTAPPPSLAPSLELGLLFHPSEFRRLVDPGPPAADAAAVEEFRALWGDKVSIRRFRDGRIISSCVWEAPGFERRHAIVPQILTHLLARHFPGATLDTKLLQLDDHAAPLPKPWLQPGATRTLPFFFSPLFLLLLFPQPPPTPPSLPVV